MNLLEHLYPGKWGFLTAWKWKFTLSGGDVLAGTIFPPDMHNDVWRSDGYITQVGVPNCQELFRMRFFLGEAKREAAWATQDLLLDLYPELAGVLGVGPGTPAWSRLDQEWEVPDSYADPDLYPYYSPVLLEGEGDYIFGFRTVELKLRGLGLTNPDSPICWNAECGCGFFTQMFSRGEAALSAERHLWAAHPEVRERLLAAAPKSAWERL